MDKQELYEEVEDLDIFNLGIRKYVALNEVMYLIRQLDEPQKVVIPQFVADWIEYCKDNGYTLKYALYFTNESNNEEVYEWVNESLNNQETFALAWINGYEIKKEKRYLVKMLGLADNLSYLNYDSIDCEWYFNDAGNGHAVGTYHTKKQLEEAGFSNVLTSSLFEVKEVE